MKTGVLDRPSGSEKRKKVINLDKHSNSSNTSNNLVDLTNQVLAPKIDVETRSQKRELSNSQKSEDLTK